MCCERVDTKKNGRMNDGSEGERARDSRRARLPSVSGETSFVTKVLWHTANKTVGSIPLIRLFRRELPLLEEDFVLFGSD